MIHFPELRNKVYYAQNREDFILEAFFPDIEKGFYVDVGANHPVKHSVTKRFYDRGWRGINFEPNPQLFKLLQKDRPRDENIMAGVADKKGSLSLRVYHSQDKLEGISTFVDTMKQYYQKTSSEDTKNYTDITAEVGTLKETFSKLKVPKIHFLKVDVEGFEYQVLAGNDWGKYRPEVICIEANHMIKDWRELLTKNNYTLVFNDGLNDYYADNSTNRAQKFDYVRSVIAALDGGIKHEYYDLLETVKESEVENQKIVTQQTKELAEKDEAIKDLAAQNQDKQNTLTSIRKTGKVLITLLKSRLKKTIKG
jgi:FkbM family methyltransferase